MDKGNKYQWRPEYRMSKVMLEEKGLCKRGEICTAKYRADECCAHVCI